jgi:hypothetical protein
VRSVQEEDTEMYTLPISTTTPATTIVHHRNTAIFASPRAGRVSLNLARTPI